MNQGISLIVYPVKDVNQAKKVYSTFLGVEPYVDGEYYVGYKVGDHEIGLDPNATTAGPIAYIDVEDIHKSLQALVDAGAKTVQDVTDVGYGLLIAKLTDADGNTIGLRQSS